MDHSRQDYEKQVSFYLKNLSLLNGDAVEIPETEKETESDKERLTRFFWNKKKRFFEGDDYLTQ
jgi:hypothetical protein